MRALLGALFWLALAPVSGLAQGVAMTGVGYISVEARTPWPSAASKGYQPLVLDIENPTVEARSLDVTVQGSWGSDGLELTRSVDIGPQERLEVELLVPSYIWDSREFRLYLQSDGDHSYSSGLGSTGNMAQYTHLVAVFYGGTLGNHADWSAAMTPAGSSPSWGQGRWRNLGLYADKDWGMNVGVVAGEVPFGDMSRRWEAYTSLDVAIVDTRSGLPPAPELEALMGWVRMGGVAILVGEDANRALAGVAAIDSWRDERFEVEAPGGLTGLQRFQCGFGRFLVIPRAGLLDDPVIQAATLAELRSKVRSDWTPSDRGSRGAGEGLRPRIPGLGTLPFRTFVALMILFAVIVGPVNFFWTKRRKKPVALLFTIPLIACIGAVLALGYGFLGQGISIRTHSDTVALLDQRTGLVSGAEVRALFAGLAPGSGLRPGQGTSIFPWGVDLVNRDDVRYEIRHGEEASYRAAFLPSRIIVRQAVLTSRGSRLRLGVESDGGGCRVENGLGVDLEELLVHDQRGDWFRLAGGLEAGASAELEPLAGPPADGDPGSDLFTFHPEVMPELPRGTYAAKSSEPAFRDDCGLDLVELSGSHHLLGVLPEGTSR